VTIVALNLSQADIAEELWALQHAAYREEARLIGVAVSELPPLQDTVLSLQACPETFYGYRTEDGGLVGAIAVEANANNNAASAAFVISRMMVHPEHFRQGIGRRLVEHALAQQPRAAWEVTAETRNAPAIALYERCGFKRGESFRPAPNIEMIRFARAKT